MSAFDSVKEYLSSTLFYNNKLIDWLVSLAIIVGSFVIAKILLWISKNMIKKITQRTKTNLDDIIIDKVESPIALAIMLAGIYVALIRLHLSGGFDKLLNNAYQIFIILNATWIIARVVDGIVKEYLMPLTEKTSKVDDNVVRILKRTVSAIIWIFGIVLALGNIGINIGAIITGLGIGGVAFALAAQDTIKNIFAGVVIFMDRPFRLGDSIRIDNNQGVVEDIGLRSVRIRTYDKKLLTISSSKVIDSVIENISKEPARRIVLPLGLTYDTSPDQMMLALELLKNLPASISEIKSEVHAFFTGYGDSSLNITFIYFIRKGANIMDVQSKVNLAILSLFNEKKLNFAFPTTTVYLEK